MFTYEALPDATFHIRVLTIKSSQYNEPLRGSLHNASLASGIGYDAISYCWGEEDDSQEILLIVGDWYEPHKIFKILDVGLRRIRMASKDVSLWNDALSIDQDNQKEKQKQVRMMDKIYSSATRVFIYLGEEDPISSRAFDLIERINNAALNTSADDPTPAMSWVGKNELPQVSQPQLWEPLKVFIRRPWFRRAWIVQECVMAPKSTFICGGWRMEWEDMYRVVKTIYRYGLAVLDHSTYGEDVEAANELQQGFSQIHYITTLKDARNRKTRYSFMEVAYRMQGSRATDPRDYLFSLLGLAHDAAVKELDPDTDLNATVLDNCIRYARHFLHAKDNLEVLYWAGMHGQVLGAPSWVPNWYGGHEGFSFEHAEGPWHPHRRPSFYNIAGGSQAQVLDTSDAKILGIRGVQIDSIGRVANDFLRTKGKHRQDKDALRAQKRQHAEQSDRIMEELTEYPTGEDKQSVQWRTLICNVAFDLNVAPDSMYHSYQVWRRALTLDHTLGPEKRKQQEAFRNVIDGYNSGKTFGSTKKGYVGILPSTTQPGDMIYVLYGEWKWDIINTRFVLLEESTKTFYDVDAKTPRLGNPSSWEVSGLSNVILGDRLAIVIPDSLDEEREAKIKEGLNLESVVGKLVSIQTTGDKTVRAKVLGRVFVKPFQPEQMSWEILEDMYSRPVLPDEMKNGLLGSLWVGLHPDRKEIHPKKSANLSRKWNTKPRTLSAELYDMFAAGEKIENGRLHWELEEDQI